jgi:outer membrane protein OmpA-like peptidoglycan-associated protein
MLGAIMRKLIGLWLVSGILAACSNSKPYNDFDQRTPALQTVAASAVIGAGIGAGIGAAVGSPSGTGAAIGAGAGAGAGFILGLMSQSQASLAKILVDEGVQIVRYGDIMTMIIPTDKVYMFGGTELNQRQYRLLNALAFYLLKEQAPTLQLAAFTDEVGSKRYKRKLSQGRAQTMMTFLWANGLVLDTMHAKGYGKRYDTASNTSVFGSQMNRRLEIQWHVSEFYTPTEYTKVIQKV